ncbi:MAG: rRNA maturation RNase YbeY [Thermomicrobiales bacterium]|nr:rRNA maturation RNase YbeY [Thermomicrobiales bacterium]MCO5228691.1 rRNA maturation RNase YbeY [Thermomicrobiales bacterium]
MIEHIVTFEIETELPPEFSEDQARSLIFSVLAAEEVDEPWLVGIQIVDDETMRTAHVEFMDIDEPTDIMTFPYADEEDDLWGDSEVGGDLMISVDRAAENAIEAGWSTIDEMHFLIVHGLLHLLGWDDHTPEDRASMLAHQRELIDQWSQEA